MSLGICELLLTQIVFVGAENISIIDIVQMNACSEKCISNPRQQSSLKD